MPRYGRLVRLSRASHGSEHQKRQLLRRAAMLFRTLRTAGLLSTHKHPHARAAQVEIARHPEIALVDEFAHTNVPGSRNEKRWQDVEELLDAGIDVISAVNIQHLESLNDVVEKITGVPQRETVPDAIVRAADQVDWAKSTVRVHLTQAELKASPTYDPSGSKEAHDKAHLESFKRWPTYWY